MGITYNTSIVRNGLVLHLDAANKKSYPGTGTVWKDLSGLGNHGTLVNGVGFNSSNKGFLTFNGSNHCIELNQYPQIYNNSVTMSGWFYFDIANTRDVLFSNYTATPNVGFERHTSDRLRLFWNSGANDVFSDNNIAPANEWLYICIIRNKDVSQFQFYVNGILRSNPSVTSADLPSVNGPFRIGRDIRTDFTALGGNCSNVQLYNRALSQSEVQQNFNALRGRYGI
jgi:hypothetical protein